MELNSISGTIVDSAITVHSALGPGLLESAYLTCLAYELRSRGLTVQSQVPLPIVYRAIKLDAGYRMDLVVNHAVIVEIKAVTKVHPIHQAQLLSYLKLSGRELGLLLNFHEISMKNGIKRMINQPRPLEKTLRTPRTLR
ncbi:MAG: GxxExxY protein [Gemmatimonas sp.]